MVGFPMPVERSCLLLSALESVCLSLSRVECGFHTLEARSCQFSEKIVKKDGYERVAGSMPLRCVVTPCCALSEPPHGERFRVCHDILFTHIKRPALFQRSAAHSFGHDT
jgi:hypothetical protein